MQAGDGCLHTLETQPLPAGISSISLTPVWVSPKRLRERARKRGGRLAPCRKLDACSLNPLTVVPAAREHLRMGGRSVRVEPRYLRPGHISHVLLL